MRDAERRAAFKAYFESVLKGDRQLLIARTGYTDGRVSQFFDPDESFGERAASNLARKLGLPDAAFDRTVFEIKAPPRDATPSLKQTLSYLQNYLLKADPANRAIAADVLARWAADPIGRKANLTPLLTLLGETADAERVAEHLKPAPTAAPERTSEPRKPMRKR